MIDLIMAILLLLITLTSLILLILMERRERIQKKQLEHWNQVFSQIHENQKPPSKETYQNNFYSSLLAWQAAMEDINNYHNKSVPQKIIEPHE